MTNTETTTNTEAKPYPEATAFLRGLKKPRSRIKNGRSFRDGLEMAASASVKGGVSYYVWEGNAYGFIVHRAHHSLAFAKRNAGTHAMCCGKASATIAVVSPDLSVSRMVVSL